MKILFTGAGSIGTRHIRNLTKLCINKHIDLEIDVLRNTERELPVEIKQLVHNEIRNNQNLANHYDVLFVTDETRTHFSNIQKYKSICKHMFIEKPIFDTPEYDWQSVLPTGDSIYYIAAPIRFTDYFAQIKKYVQENRVYSARIIFSSYMPNWQKGRDYRKSFRCSTERGGGVDIDSLHEIDYMTALFGSPDKILRVAGKYSDLEMDACDLSVYIFQYSDKVIEMHLDYFGRANNRRIELFTKDDVIVIDFNQKTVTKQLANEVIGYGEDNDFYLKEMAYFLELLLSDGKLSNINTVENAYKNLEIAKGIIV